MVELTVTVGLSVESSTLYSPPHFFGYANDTFYFVIKALLTLTFFQ